MDFKAELKKESISPKKACFIKYVVKLSGNGE